MMKVFLLHPERDFDSSRGLPPNTAELTQDLELNTLFEAMAQRDEFLFGVARQVVLSSLDEIDTFTIVRRFSKTVWNTLTSSGRFTEFPWNLWKESAANGYGFLLAILAQVPF